ncbi:hypothetical protein [Amycolatopsis pretoriensis]|uniref:hypothetical protein n=1 Tax=Amycolatopsis pretoriensis TaxID=218821 RepID=UPI00130234F0|nr:hypothetical protein [Amycolatopsis pretoriensis]
MDREGAAGVDEVGQAAGHDLAAVPPDDPVFADAGQPRDQPVPPPERVVVVAADESTGTDHRAADERAGIVSVYGDHDADVIDADGEVAGVPDLRRGEGRAAGRERPGDVGRQRGADVRILRSFTESAGIIDRGGDVLRPRKPGRHSLTTADSHDIQSTPAERRRQRTSS